MMFFIPKKNLLFFLSVISCIIISPSSLFATHQRAAEIMFHRVSGNTYHITLISYTYTPSPANAYRDYLTINWGDGATSQIHREQETYLPNDITFNRYEGEHTYAGPGTFIISCEDPNRNGGILNIPNSINTPMFIYSELVINPFLGYDNSPILLIPPVDNACVDQPFYHNPGAYDPDGDSLSYRLVTCLGAQGQPIPGYTLPPATHTIHLDSITGDFFWDSPPQQGEYNIAILIEEWRNGIKIGSVERDMQIIVIACDDHPPVVVTPDDTCIEAGQTLGFSVSAYDPDSLDQVTLSGSGQPLLLTDHPASLVPNPAIGIGHTQSVFTWPTACSEVLEQPYRMYFKAEDNASPVHLVSFKTMDIRVVGPPPENLTATPLGTSITLHWDDYICQNASGFYIYRHVDSTGYVPGYCQTGVPPYLGYQRIAELDGLSQTFYTDDNAGAGLVQGVKYCYLVVAFYPDKALSLASNEACAHLKKDVAVITNVSVRTTAGTDGSMYVAWSKPTEIDSSIAPGPYKYLIYRSIPTNPGQFMAIDSMPGLNDTIYVDTFLNTQTYPYKYRIDLYNLTPGNRFLIGESQVASSVFLTLFPTDKRMRMYWNNNVPWTNTRFDIYRKDPGSSTYDSVGTSPVPHFIDHGLVNGEEYCYFIKTWGAYSATGFIFPILNWSQTTCAVPVDNVPPCKPVLHVKTDCDKQQNLLSWINPGDTCSPDIAKYYIYYTSLENSDLVLIDSVLNASDTSYTHDKVVGCYAIRAVDSVGNISDFSDTVCVDYTACSIYDIPNVFTPNGDNVNDLLVPRKKVAVDHISLVIFDRWGKKVYETTDPDINWNGDDMTTHQPCSDGVYFYVCDVYEITLQGPLLRTLKGSVTILR
ncbi:MAG TPA: gliding motility-associated C-terminal domain-containing protein [Bacteroidales bacterium]|nr:gliding motility-associated C-terminal domain-containing protein [Bacteroidales bacterium]